MRARMERYPSVEGGFRHSTVPSGDWRAVIWDEGRGLWVDPLNGDTYAPGEQTFSHKQF